MENKFNLEIEGFGLIDKAKIEINKINVVGGVNASGKSTASKLLYCFLKSNSPDIKEYVLAAILPTINKFINIMEHPDPYAKVDLPDKYTVKDDMKTILSNYLDAKKIFKGLNKEHYFEIPEEIFDEMIFRIDRFVLFLLDKEKSRRIPKRHSSIIRTLFENESLLSFKGKSIFYNNLFKCFVSYESTDNIWPIYERAYELDKKGISSDDFDENFIYSSEGSFNSLNNVFYIDSISYFDLIYYLNNSSNKDKEIFGYKEHVEYILKKLDSNKEENLSENIKEKMDSLNESITEIIHGHIYKTYDDYFLLDNLDYYFVPKDSEEQYNVNISSGIQQISIIQLLLDKYILQPNSFLIIDEPEVNLHPEWQFKFAEILVLLAKELDITIYINSHSPTFIESIDAFTEFYDMEDDINYYLTEESENKGKYKFTKINSNELYKIYDNLGNVYDLIDRLRLRKKLGE